MNVLYYENITYFLLKLQEQIMPILDLMASMSSPHFAKLKDFIQMQLPSGFPVKIGNLYYFNFKYYFQIQLIITNF